MFDYKLALLGWFIAFIIHKEFNISYRIKRLFKIHPTRYVKLIDCFPCITFWVTLAISLIPLTAIGAYLISIFTDRNE